MYYDNNYIYFCDAFLTVLDAAGAYPGAMIAITLYVILTQLGPESQAEAIYKSQPKQSESTRKAELISKIKT